MMTIVRRDEGAQASEQEVAATLDDLAREGARRMIVAALEVEVTEYLARYRESRDERGHARVVRNGQARPRRLTVGSGTVPIAAPRVNDQRVVHGVRQKFTSPDPASLSAPVTQGGSRLAAALFARPL